MGLPFLSSPISLKPTTNPDTPFQKAKQEWDTRIGSSVAQAKNWRCAFFVASFITTLLSVVVVIQSNRATVVPVLIGIDKESGEPTIVGAASEKQYKLGALEVKYFLTQFIRFVRAVPTDQVVIKQNWLRAYSFLKADAAGLLNEMTNKDEDSPLKKIGKVIVSVQPLSVVQIPETSSYQVRWRETSYSSTGNKLEEYTMLGTFVIDIESPKDEKTLQENPLGIFIRNFQWNREL